MNSKRKSEDISNETAQLPTAEELEKKEKKKRFLEEKARGKAWGDTFRADKLAQRSAAAAATSTHHATTASTTHTAKEAPSTKAKRKSLENAPEVHESHAPVAKRRRVSTDAIQPMPPAAAAVAPIFTSPAKPKLPKTKLTAAQQRQRAREWAAQQGYIPPIQTISVDDELSTEEDDKKPAAAVPPPVFEPPAAVPTATTGPMFMPFINLEPSSPIPGRFTSAAPAPTANGPTVFSNFATFAPSSHPTTGYIPSSSVFTSGGAAAPATIGFTATIGGIPVPVRMEMPPPTMAPPFSPPVMTSHSGTAYIEINSSNAACSKEDQALPIPSMMSPTRPKRSFRFYMVVTVAVILIAYIFLLVHGPTTTDTLTHDYNLPVPMTVEEETTSSSSSPRSCFQNNVEYTSTEGEGLVVLESYASCDPTLPLLPCPGTCNHGMIIDCENTLHVPSDDKRSCVYSAQSKILMNQLLSVLSDQTVHAKCNFQPTEDGILFVPITQVATELDKDPALVKLVITMDHNIISKEDHLGLSSDYVRDRLNIPFSCWLKLWLVWFLSICVEYSLTALAWMIQTSFKTVTYLFGWMSQFVYEHPGYALASFVCTWACLQYYQRKALRKTAGHVKELALAKLARCEQGKGYLSLCLRDEIACEQYPLGGPGRDHFILKIWPRVAYEIRCDNRVNKKLMKVEGKGEMEYMEWICEPSRKK